MMAPLRFRSVPALIACAGVLVTASVAAAQQSSPPGKPSKTKVVRRPIIDLKKQADEPRPGQIMPGQPRPADEPPPQPVEASQPAPAQPAPAPQPPAEPPPPAEQVDIPDTPPPKPTTTPAARLNRPLKPAPVPVNPEVEPAPAPQPQPQPAAMEPVAQPEPVPEPAYEAPPATPAMEPEPTSIEMIDAPQATRPTAVAPMGEPTSAKITGIEGPADVIQWRVDEGEWAIPGIGNTARGILDVRTGLGASITLTLGEQVVVKVSRLTRVRFEQRTPETPGLPTELVVDLTRGEVDIKPLPAPIDGTPPAIVRIITPDKNYTTRLATGVRYDAFTGTRTRMVAGER